MNPFGGGGPGMGGMPMPGMGGGPPMSKKMLRAQKEMIRQQQRELDANRPRPKKNRKRKR